jgi:hypothetical protein
MMQCLHAGSSGTARKLGSLNPIGVGRHSSRDGGGCGARRRCSRDLCRCLDARGWRWRRRSRGARHRRRCGGLRWCALGQSCARRGRRNGVRQVHRLRARYHTMQRLHARSCGTAWKLGSPNPIGPGRHSGRDGWDGARRWCSRDRRRCLGACGRRRRARGARHWRRHGRGANRCGDRRWRALGWCHAWGGCTGGRRSGMRHVHRFRARHHMTECVQSGSRSRRWKFGGAYGISAGRCGPVGRDGARRRCLGARDRCRLCGRCRRGGRRWRALGWLRDSRGRPPGRRRKRIGYAQGLGRARHHMM